METNTKLRKFQNGRQQKWTLEQIQAGLECFKELNDRYPSAREIDSFEFLPSAKSIQRSFGGLEKIRMNLGFDPQLINLTRGTMRSNKVREIMANSLIYEKAFYEFLIEQIPEVRVHEQKILRPAHNRCDFVIYTTNRSGFAIDIFYAQDIFTMSAVIREKLLTYRNVTCRVHFVVVGNNTLTQEVITTMLSKRKTTLPNNVQVWADQNFKENFSKLIRGE